jgi:hypothetical protein
MLGPVRADSAITLDESLRCCDDNSSNHRVRTREEDYPEPEIDSASLLLRKESWHSQTRTSSQEGEGALGHSVPELAPIDQQAVETTSQSAHSVMDDESQTSHEQVELLDGDAVPKPISRQRTNSPCPPEIQQFAGGNKEPTKVLSIRDAVREQLAKDRSAGSRSRTSRQDSAPSLGASIRSRRSTGDVLGESSERSAAPKRPQRQLSTENPEDLGISNEDTSQLRKPQRQVSRDDVTAFDEINFEPEDNPVKPRPECRRRRSMNDLQALLNQRSTHSRESMSRQRSGGCLQLPCDDSTQSSQQRSLSPRSRAAPKRESGLVDDVRSVHGHQSLNGLSALTKASRESRNARRDRRRRKKTDSPSRHTTSTSNVIKKPNFKKRVTTPISGHHSASQILDEAWVEKWLDSQDDDGSTSSASSFSSRSAPFQWRAGQKLQESEKPADGLLLQSSARAPVEFVIVDREEKLIEHVTEKKGRVIQMPMPIMVEATSGTRTTMDADVSLTWAYDPTTGTYRMMQMETRTSPWLCVCGQENDGDFNFCGMCATPQRWTCANCNFSKNKCRFPHCGGCGTRRAAKMDVQPPRPSYLVPPGGAIY